MLEQAVTRAKVLAGHRAGRSCFSVLRLLGEPGGRLAPTLWRLPARALHLQWDLLPLAGPHLPQLLSGLPRPSAHSVHSWLQAHPSVISGGDRDDFSLARTWTLRGSLLLAG